MDEHHCNSAPAMLDDFNLRACKFHMASFLSLIFGGYSLNFPLGKYSIKGGIDRTYKSPLPRLTERYFCNQHYSNTGMTVWIKFSVQ